MFDPVQYKRDWNKAHPGRGNELRREYVQRVGKKEINRRLREYRKTHKEKVFAAYLKYHYSITIKDWQKIFDKQKGKCKICGKHQNELGYRLHIDHDHSTGRIRCLLCRECNCKLGWLENHFDIVLSILKEDFHAR